MMLAGVPVPESIRDKIERNAYASAREVALYLGKEIA